MRWTRTDSYSAPRWPRARSHTRNFTRRRPHCLTTGTIDSAFMLSVHAHISLPRKPLTATCRYAHSRVYSTGCQILTPRGAHTLRTHPIKPTRISSPQKSCLPSGQPRACRWVVNPLFSRRLGRLPTPGGHRGGEFSFLILHGQNLAHTPVDIGDATLGLRPLYPIPDAADLAGFGPGFQLVFLRRTQAGGTAPMPPMARR